MFNTRNSAEYVGLTVKDILFDETKIVIEFKEGKTIFITDEGQLCCEKRYISSDDDVRSIINGQIKSITKKTSNDIKKEMDYETGDNVHDCCFVEIQTNIGFITFCTHNEHNGYYSGFDINIKELGEVDE